MNTIGEQLLRKSQRRRETIRLYAIGVGTGVVVLGIVLAAFELRRDPPKAHESGNNAIEEAEELLAKEQERTGELKTSLEEMTSERDRALSAIEKKQAEFDRLKAKADVIEQDADLTTSQLQQQSKLLFEKQEADRKVAEAKQELSAAHRLVEQEKERLDDKLAKFMALDPVIQAFLTKVGEDVKAGKEISLETAKLLWQTGLGLKVADERLSKDGALDPADQAFLHSMTDKLKDGGTLTVEEAKRVEEVIGPGPVTNAVLKEAARP